MPDRERDVIASRRNARYGHWGRRVLSGRRTERKTRTVRDSFGARYGLAEFMQAPVEPAGDVRFDGCRGLRFIASLRGSATGPGPPVLHRH